MECTNLVDPHQLLCHWFTVVFVLFCKYTPDDLIPRPIVKQKRRSTAYFLLRGTRLVNSFPEICLTVFGLFWILSDSNVSLEEQIWLTECIYLADYFKLRKKKEKTEWNVFFNHMVGIKTTDEQILILCHNDTIFYSHTWTMKFIF